MPISEDTDDSGRSPTRLWQDGVAVGLLYLAVGVVALTAVDTVVLRLSVELAVMIPAYDPIVSLAILVSSIVAALVFTSIRLKTFAMRRRKTNVVEVNLGSAGGIPCAVLPDSRRLRDE